MTTPQLITIIAAACPFVLWVEYVALVEAFHLGVAWAHYCIERFENSTIDWQEVREWTRRQQS